MHFRVFKNGNETSNDDADILVVTTRTGQSFHLEDDKDGRLVVRARDVVEDISASPTETFDIPAFALKVSR